MHRWVGIVVAVVVACGCRDFSKFGDVPGGGGPAESSLRATHFGLRAFQWLPCHLDAIEHSLQRLARRHRERLARLSIGRGHAGQDRPCDGPIQPELHLCPGR